MHVSKSDRRMLGLGARGHALGYLAKQTTDPGSKDIDNLSTIKDPLATMLPPNDNCQPNIASVEEHPSSFVKEKHLEDPNNYVPMPDIKQYRPQVGTADANK